MTKFPAAARFSGYWREALAGEGGDRIPFRLK
jgi:hypothetical protein